MRKTPCPLCRLLTASEGLMNAGGAWHRAEGQGQEGWKRPRLNTAVQAERASMWDARQVLQRKLQVELQKMAVQEVLVLSVDNICPLI